ncbi:uncharacterized protein LOC143571627 [Bidens hawaiensis]|uniref:uncharacterized protein LOC143571627 n=1 Tax=Bidens hawaiensis TaxID=980011 RepID=UPI00404A0B50
MELDVPTDLINESEMGFREAVGLSSFNRNDTNLPSICTIEASIASLDRRCEYCSGKLLRGLDSLICIYCGEYQTTNPEPISFNSTHGYTWLLQALNFNGLEAVGSLAEGRGITGGPSPGEDEFTISDLLDLKISWQAASKKPKNNINIKTSEHNSSPNLGTPNVDFFIESKRDVVADVSEEQPHADQNKTLEDQESFTSDWNAEFQFADTKMENENLGVPVFDFFTESNRDVVPDAPEEQPVSSQADQNKTYEDQEIFTSDWNAEFQSADTKMEKESLESVGPYVGADADLSAHLDFVFGQKTDKRPVDDSVPFQDEAVDDSVPKLTKDRLMI